jgi:hypothetical protein
MDGWSILDHVSRAVVSCGWIFGCPMSVIGENIRRMIFFKLSTFESYWAVFQELSEDGGLGDYKNLEDFLPLLAKAKENADQDGAELQKLNQRKFLQFLDTLGKNLKAVHLEEEHKIDEVCCARTPSNSIPQSTTYL